MLVDDAGDVLIAQGAADVAAGGVEGGQLLSVLGRGRLERGCRRSARGGRGPFRVSFPRGTLGFSGI